MTLYNKPKSIPIPHFFLIMPHWFQSRELSFLLVLLFTCCLITLYLVRDPTKLGDVSQVEHQQEKSICKKSKELFNLNAVQTFSTEPRVFVYPNFLSDEECDRIIQLGIADLEASQVAGPSGPMTSTARSSSGTFLKGNDFLTEIEERIAIWTQLPVGYGEHFYLLQYEEGQEYKPHYDFFDPAIPGMDRFLGVYGQRVATVLLYLSTPEAGGGTIFPQAGISVAAVKGTAVLFHSVTPTLELDFKSMHGGLPVEKGVKYCCTKWIRENPYPR